MKVRVLLTLTVLSLLFLNSFAQDDGGSNASDNTLESNTHLYDSVVPSIKLKSEEEYKKLLNTTDVTYLLYFYKRIHQKSQDVTRSIIKIAKKLEFLASVIMVDCATKFGQTQRECVEVFEAPSKYPKVRIARPPQFRMNPYTHKFNDYEDVEWDESYQLTEDTVYNFITNNIPSRSSKLATENLDLFTGQNVFNKVLLFSDKPKTPLLYRGLSNYFYDRMLFGEVDQTETFLVKKFKIQKFPTLVVFQTHDDDVKLDEPKVHFYTGKIDATSIVSFLEKYALPEKTYVSFKTSADVLSREKAEIKKISSDNYSDAMSSAYEKRVIIAFTENGEFPKELNNFTKLTGGFFTFMNFNCGHDKFNVCKHTFKVDQYPSMRLYNPGPYLEKRIKTSVDLPMKERELQHELLREFQNEDITMGAYQTFLGFNRRAQENGRIAVGLFYNDRELYLPYYLLTHDKRLSKLFHYAIFENPIDELLKMVGLKKTDLPKMILFIPSGQNVDSARPIQYTGEFVYSKMKRFMDSYLEIIDENKKKDEYVPETKEAVTYYSDLNTMNEHCLGKRKVCVIGFLDGRRKSKELIDRHEDNLKTLGSVLDKTVGKPFSYGWVNATCQTDLTSSFGLNTDSLPNLVVYIPAKKLYSQLIGTFDEENLISYIDRVISGKTALLTMDPSAVTFKDVNCADLKEQESQENLEDDEILKEIIAEEKRKREEFEKERAESKKKGKKKGKKKKKDL